MSIEDRRQIARLCPWSRACKEPKMTNYRGRTWDYAKVWLSDGREIRGYLDTTWGEYIYFEFQPGRWRKVSILSSGNNPRIGDDGLINFADWRPA